MDRAWGKPGSKEYCNTKKFNKSSLCRAENSLAYLLDKGKDYAAYAAIEGYLTEQGALQVFLGLRSILMGPSITQEPGVKHLGPSKYAKRRSNPYKLGKLF